MLGHGPNLRLLTLSIIISRLSLTKDIVMPIKKLSKSLVCVGNWQLAHTNKIPNNYSVVRMSQSEIPVAIAWAKQEGWNPGLHDAQCFYNADPHGFFAGKLDGKIIAVGANVIYDNHFAFYGLYIVDPAYRGQGFGFALTRALHDYAGTRNVGLDGVVAMQKKYERLGYKFAYNNARYCGTCQFPVPTKTQAIIPLSHVNFMQLTAYDRRHFPAPRDKFLRCWIHQKGSRSLAYCQNDTLLGYGVIRPCCLGFKIGPLFADTPSIANELFLHLAHHANGQPFYLDIPECNPHAIDLVKRYTLEKVFETARMYLQSPPVIAVQQIYGITSFELG